jgi:DNA-binding beta-propeller fold protein YncE
MSLQRAVPAVIVAIACLTGAPAALAVPLPVFTPVTGSPFATALNPTSVAFSPDGSLVATASQGASNVSVFSAAASGALTPVAGSPFAAGNGPFSVAFNPAGTLLASAGTGSDDVSVFSVAPGGAATPVAGSPFTTGSGTGPFAVAFSPDGHLLATANHNGSTVSVFTVAAGGALTPVAGSPFALGSSAHPDAVAFNPDGTLLAVANENGTASVFSVAPSDALTPVAGSPFAMPGTPLAAAFSLDGALLAVTSATTDVVSVFSVSAAGALTPVAGSPYPTGAVPRSVAFGPGGLMAVANYAANRMSVYSVSASGVLTEVAGSPYATGTYPDIVAFRPSGGLLATTNLLSNNLTMLAGGAPTATITVPADHQRFTQGEAVAARFSCADPAGAPGISSCTGDATLDTTTLGTHPYTVTATSLDGLTRAKTITYTVVAPAPADPATTAPAQTTDPAAAPLPTPATTPAPAPPAAKGGATLAPLPTPGRVTVDGKSSVTLPLLCAVDSPCTVTGSLTVAPLRPLADAHAAAARHRVLGRFGTTIAAGDRHTVTVRLTASYRRSLRRRHLRTLAATLTVRTTLGDGTSSAVALPLKLALPA